MAVTLLILIRDIYSSVLMIHISQVRLRNFKSFKIVNVEIPKTFLCLAGPNGSGKCVDGDTRVLLADGAEIKIRDLVEEALASGHVEKIEDGFIAQHPTSKNILSLNPETLKLERKPIGAFVKRKTPDKMLKVRTRSGREIIATEYHPFFIFDKDQIRPIRADQLIVKTKIAVPKKLLSDPKDKTDILWDEITHIETIKPREEWVYDLSIAGNHNFVANRFIIHNSNLTDSIRFVMGEIALKSLRAKKVKDLIHTGAKTAEVTLNFDGDEQIEVKRAIRDDGKVLYKLNGKKTTRSMILDIMKKYNLDESGRNIIAQGEVARIINMNGKERRQIIDAVAGISDFESKKKESMGELETVDTRIKEANLVLGERIAFLTELEKEKEAAISYRAARKNLTDAKGTVLKTESKRLTKELEESKSLEEKIRAGISSKEADMQEIEKKINDKEAERQLVSKTLQEKNQGSGFIRKIEELKASVSTKSQMIVDREGLIAKSAVELESLSKESENVSREIKELESTIASLKDELKPLESLAASHGGAAMDDGMMKLKAAVEQAAENLQKLRERSISIKSEIDSKNEIMKMKNAEAGRIDVPGEDEDSDFRKEIEKLKKASKELADEIDESFRRNKEINAEMGELDKKLLELKETASIYKLRASPQLANPALQLIASMRESDGHSIHGIVADLIQFDPKYAHAVEAAAGARLLYVVVDDIDIATGVIDKLKKAKAGRATFIPISGVKVSRPVQMNGFSSILDVVRCDNRVRRAMEYVFGETLLVDTVEDAKRIGSGELRIVTLDGEIFERSGIISGGRAQSSILSGNALRKIENDIAQVKSTKDSLIQELYSLRESESGSRARKSEIEIRIKTIEMEMRQQDEEREKSRNLISQKKALDAEAHELEELVKEKEKELRGIESDIEKSAKNLIELKDKLENAEKKLEIASEESSRKRADLASKVSSIRATIEGRAKELELRKQELRDKDGRRKDIEKERKESLGKITELKRQVTGEQEELAKLEVQITSHSREVEKLFEALKAFEAELREIGTSRGEKRIELDRLSKDLNQLEIKKASVSTRLEDVSSESAQYPEFEFLEGVKKDELMKMIKEAETTIASMPNVNMAAIEMYDRKKQEIEGVEGKIMTLEQERKAILTMISEIEQHKKDAFFKTYYEISENFKKMFKYITIGEGYLYMDNPNEPFESGLHIRIKRTGKDGKVHEHTLDSLSGGENSLVALMFIFAMQFFKPSPFYILDEVDAALDKENSKNLAQLISGMAKDTQFILVSHNDMVMSSADAVFGVTKVQGVSKLVGVKLEPKAA